jgi:hypothetical protein
VRESLSSHIEAPAAPTTNETKIAAIICFVMDVAMRAVRPQEELIGRMEHIP